MRSIELIAPDDWHIHLRDTPYLVHTVKDALKSFSRVLAMPNLTPPLTRVADITAYRERILKTLPQDSTFTPYFALYLKENTDPSEIMLAKKSAFILGAKLYPAGVTTHSEEGVHSLKKLYPLFEVMQACGLVLEIHGEKATPEIDLFARESSFIKNTLIPMIRNFPRLKIVLEHISTHEAVDFIQNGSPHIAATLTPHHLLLNRNDLLQGSLKPHYYCMPILKTKADQRSLVRAATSGDPHFFLGTDSAPHGNPDKHSAHCPAGIYHAPFAMALYAEVFEEAGDLSKLENFSSRFGADFYGLSYNTTRIILEKTPQKIPETLPFGEGFVTPLRAGQTLNWTHFHEKNPS